MIKELKRFEKWWDAGDDIPNNGPYTPDTPIQFAWAGWQAALAQPEQEPVAWMRQDGQRVTTASDRHNYPDYETRYSIPLYTHPPQRTEQEPVAWMTITGYGEEDDIHYENPEGHLMEGWTYKPLYTHPPQPDPVQEPVAWMEMVVANLVREGVNKHNARELAEHFYTAPSAAQREWVGLTDEERRDIATEVPMDAVCITEAKLKEKNFDTN